ncbi:ammonia-dependent NAD(+) synthetase [Aureibacillus halotolerans]|uniref:NH(3)-dependent NAD(+) synthetase n=1 Tax=Aureibacillus halotolerans TaxID=1508390 RepID=A0A4R6U135_9BACI|nr:ammonia-dependent NAD(+) synthetase [Aureibacillus halotolerans]TDQ36754.1 NH(3)-dependent NAD(+) synthetase [Aureibacillus halotolerans]
MTRQLQEHIIKELGVKSSIDPVEEIKQRIGFLKEYAKRSGAKGYVLGISGGQDSSLAGKLAQMAVNELKEETGNEYTFVAVRLPYGQQHDEDDAQRALAFIQPDRKVTVDLKPAVDASAASFEKAMDHPISDFLKGNIKARERMKVQYDIAADQSLLVIGTDHAAEAVTGFYTKFGDGACDITPLFGLDKRQGRALLQELGADEAIYTKVPTADLEDDKPGIPDEVALGVTYEQIDDYLEGKEIDKAASESIESRFMKTRHKRVLPVTIFDDWYKQ